MEMKINSVAFVTLGCKLNYSESSTFARQFSDNGYQIVPSSKRADIYVVNTCSVTEHSDKKCRNIIRRLHQINPEAIIAVTGCYAQLKSEEILNIEGVDLVIGAQNKGELFAKVAEIDKKGRGSICSCDINKVSSIFPAYSSGERTRSFLKVQDGCDYKCSYCTVPYARGKSRNLPIDLLVDEARKISSSGIKEIVLTGVNIGDYGKTTGESFLHLLQALNEVDGIQRYRISSIEPNLLTDEIIRWISSGTKFLPHFHIPLQSGCDSILAAMHRRYNTDMFRKKIDMIRSRIDNVFLGIDVIVGFPGESEDDFMTTYHFLEEIHPAFLHVFPYSRRPGTPAAEMIQVIDSIKDNRVRLLEELSDRLHSDFYNSNRGKEEEVLFESTVKGGKMYGYTRNYLRIEHQYDKSLIGKIVKIVIP